MCHAKGIQNLCYICLSTMQSVQFQCLGVQGFLRRAKGSNMTAHNVDLKPVYCWAGADAIMLEAICMQCLQIKAHLAHLSFVLLPCTSLKQLGQLMVNLAG